VATAAGLQSVEMNMLRLCRSLRMSDWQILVRVRFPTSPPFIFSGMKVAVTLAIIGIVVGEFIASQRGLGYLILFASSRQQTDLALACIAVLCLVGLVLYGVAGVTQKLATNNISTELSTVCFALAFIPVALVAMLFQPVNWHLTRGGWGLSVLTGALISTGTLTLFAAYRTGKASVVTALTALYPALTVLLAVPLFHERVDARKLFAIAMALGAGVALTYEKPSATAG